MFKSIMFCQFQLMGCEKDPLEIECLSVPLRSQSLELSSSIPHIDTH